MFGPKWNQVINANERLQRIYVIETNVQQILRKLLKGCVFFFLCVLQRESICS